MTKNVVFRADDAGSSLGATAAIIETVRQGVTRNVSVMVPGPAFFESVSALKELKGIDLGLHVTLSAEWDFIKWGPVAEKALVATLIDDQGAFTSSPGVLHERGFSLDEALHEVECQLAQAREAGLAIAYLDEHMGVGWLPGLADRLRDLALREGLVYANSIPFLPGADTQDAAALHRTILEGPDCPHVVVAHPGSDQDPIMRGFTFGDIPPGQILSERAKTAALTPALFSARQ